MPPKKFPPGYFIGRRSDKSTPSYNIETGALKIIAWNRALRKNGYLKRGKGTAELFPSKRHSPVKYRAVKADYKDIYPRIRGHHSVDKERDENYFRPEKNSKNQSNSNSRRIAKREQKYWAEQKKKVAAANMIRMAHPVRKANPNVRAADFKQVLADARAAQRAKKEKRAEATRAKWAGKASGSGLTPAQRAAGNGQKKMAAAISAAASSAAGASLQAAKSSAAAASPSLTPAQKAAATRKANKETMIANAKAEAARIRAEEFKNFYVPRTRSKK